MIVLSAATYTLQLILSAGTADVDVSYVDRTATAYPIGATEQTAATATTQTICSAPAASTSREIDFLSVKIKTTGGVVTVQKLNSSGSVTTQLISVTLLDEEVLTYTHGSGWCALDANGNRKEATSSTFGAITATSITDSGLTATRVVFSGVGGLLSDDSGFTFNTTGDILTVGALNVAGTTAPTTGWYNPSGTVLRTPNAVTLDAALTYGGVTLSNAVTGTGSMVLSTSPTLVTPALGTPSALVGTNITGTAAGLTAGSVTTNANLTGPITSAGNATSVASQTGTGSTFAMSASPTFTGTVSAAAIAASGTITTSSTAISGYKWDSWLPTDVTGTATNAPSTGTSDDSAFTSAANSSGTLTYTFDVAGRYLVTLTGETAQANTYTFDRMIFNLGGTATRRSFTNTLAMAGNSTNSANFSTTTSFIVIATAGQTLTILPTYELTGSGTTSQHVAYASANTVYLGG